MVWLVLSLVSLGLWIYFFLGRDDFWRCDQRLTGTGPEPAEWPSVVAVIPARDEAETIRTTVGSLLAQDYPGNFRIVVVDDHSTDGTAAAAGQDDRLTVISGTDLPEGWTGKLWAVHQGIAKAGETEPAFLLLTDADITHDAGNLKRLVMKAEADQLDLVSLMVRLSIASLWERLLIPAFVYFFQKLYPFPAVNNPNRRLAAAAGGCMLVRSRTLVERGGIQEIKGCVIDDCALGALMKRDGGRIWLGLAGRTHSSRAYDGLGPIWRMVARTAFVQLDHSALNLLGTVLGMAFIYVVPVAAFLLGGGLPTAVAGLTLILMVMLYHPTLRLYGLSPWWALTLPFAGLLYTLMTLDSARRHWMGLGNAWKGRSHPAS
ncbi:MAG: glycosyltransferase [Magnetovibrionaceae bacterium]